MTGGSAHLELVQAGSRHSTPPTTTGRSTPWAGAHVGHDAGRSRRHDVHRARGDQALLARHRRPLGIADDRGRRVDRGRRPRRDAGPPRRSRVRQRRSRSSAPGARSGRSRARRSSVRQLHRRRRGARCRLTETVAAAMRRSRPAGTGQAAAIAERGARRTDADRNASTTAASNWLPAQRQSSPQASA